MNFFGGSQPTEKYLKNKIQDKEKASVGGDSDRQQTEQQPRNCFRCRYEYNLIDNCPKPPKDNDKQGSKVCFNERGNRAPEK